MCRGQPFLSCLKFIRIVVAECPACLKLKKIVSIILYVLDPAPDRHPEVAEQAAAGVHDGEARVVDRLPAVAGSPLPQGPVDDAVDTFRRRLNELLLCVVERNSAKRRNSSESKE